MKTTMSTLSSEHDGNLDHERTWVGRLFCVFDHKKSLPPRRHTSFSSWGPGRHIITRLHACLHQISAQRRLPSLTYVDTFKDSSLSAVRHFKVC